MNYTARLMELETKVNLERLLHSESKPTQVASAKKLFNEAKEKRLQIEGSENESTQLDNLKSFEAKVLEKAFDLLGSFVYTESINTTLDSTNPNYRREVPSCSVFVPITTTDEHLKPINPNSIIYDLNDFTLDSDWIKKMNESLKVSGFHLEIVEIRHFLNTSDDYI